MAAQQIIFPPEWDDDEKMQFQFSKFRDNRMVNPVSWDAKMSFWSNLIINYSRTTGSLLIDPSNLPQIFQRKGKYPQCLPKVVEHLKREGKLQPIDDYYTSTSRSWLSWGYQAVIKKPFKWGFHVLFRKPLNWGLNYVIGTGALGDQDETLIVYEVVKEKCAELLRCHCSHEPNTSVVISYNDLLKQHKEHFKNQSDLDLVLYHLSQENKCVIINTSSQHKVVRFASTEGQVVDGNDMDINVYSLTATMSQLKTQIEELESEVGKLRAEAVRYKSLQQTQMALECLRKKKKIEKAIEQKEAALSNVEHMLHTIDQAKTNKLLVDAFSKGNAAFQELTKKDKLNMETVENIMQDIDESMAQHDEVTDALSFPVQAPGADITMSELEEELQDILHESTSSFEIDKLVFPPVPKDEPIITGAKRPYMLTSQ